MRPLILLTLLAAAPALAAPADDEARLAALLQGRTAGAPRHCLPRGRDNQSHTINHIGFVYDVGSTRYLMRFQGGCPSLTQFTAIVTRTPTTEWCEGDIAELFVTPAPVTPVGSCVFGPFTPYARAR